MSLFLSSTPPPAESEPPPATTPTPVAEQEPEASVSHSVTEEETSNAEKISTAETASSSEETSALENAPGAEKAPSAEKAAAAEEPTAAKYPVATEKLPGVESLSLDDELTVENVVFRNLHNNNEEFSTSFYTLVETINELQDENDVPLFAIKVAPALKKYPNGKRKVVPHKENLFILFNAKKEDLDDEVVLHEYWEGLGFWVMNVGTQKIIVKSVGGAIFPWLGPTKGFGNHRVAVSKQRVSGVGVELNIDSESPGKEIRLDMGASRGKRPEPNYENNTQLIEI
jgi:hypothetical protein